MASKDNVFSKGISKPGRYGSLGNTDMASIKKMLAEDISDELAEVTVSEKDSAGLDGKLVEETPLIGSNEGGTITGKADLKESAEEASGSEEQEGGDTKELQRLNVEVDATLHSQFKAMVGMRKTTMRQVVESFMQSYVDEVKQEFFPSK